MKVSLSWLKELVDYKLSPKELEELISLHTYPTKGVTDAYLELDLKGYNRPDLLSMRGVAMEVSALTESQLKFDADNTVYKELLTPEIVPQGIEARVDIPELVPLYCLAKIEGLKAGVSSSKWRKKLDECGIRSINNIADVTNLIMLEFGQPLHAFDALTVADEQIIVRLAKPSENITTLDGKVRQLVTTDLLIADNEKVLGVAGVMGGQNSEITESTTAIILELAIFDPSSIRKTATRLNLNSEASKRFQHGLTKKRLFEALHSAIQMYEQLGGKITKIAITGKTDDQIRTINLSSQKVISLIGVNISKDIIEQYLTRLRFKLIPGNDGWEVEVPHFGLDIEAEEDLVEEVARMYGYDKIPSNPLQGELPDKIDQSRFERIYHLKTKLSDLGLTEVETYSYHSTQVLNNIVGDKQTLIKVSNPMSAETEYLRGAIWPNLIEVVARNIKQGFEDIAVFELGKVFWAKPGQGHQEFYDLGVALMNNSDNPLAELYQIFNKLSQEVRIDLTLKPGEVPDQVKDIVHPKRFVHIKKDEEWVGGLSELHPRILYQFGVNKRVAVLGLQLKVLL